MDKKELIKNNTIMRKQFLFICLSWLIALTANADNLNLYLTTDGLVADPNSDTPYATTDTSIEEGTVVTINYAGVDKTTALSIYINGKVVSSGKIRFMTNNPYSFTAKKNCILRVEGAYAFNFSTNPNVYFTQNVDVTGVTLSQTEAAMTVGGETLTLTPTVAPSNATNKTVTWTTSDPTVATVADGTVTAVAAGTATITATATNGTDDTSDDFSATCEVSVSTTVTANEGATGEYWATYYNGTTSFTADENTTVYQAAVNSGKTAVVLTEVTGREIPAGKAVILKSTAASITLTPATTTATLSGNELTGVDVATAAPSNAYCLSKETTGSARGVGFYTYTGTIPAHRSYLVVAGGPSLTRGFLGFGDDDNTTGISLPEAVVIENDGPIYDLSGRRIIGQPQKGIYVKNGKKFVIK